MNKLKIMLKNFIPKLHWTMYEVNKKKYLALYRIRFGRLVWSRHFLIENVLNDRGKIQNCEDENRLQIFISSSNK